ncbi:MAG: hypothetical protein ACP5PJ_07350, partial [Acidimicrobiales bacterium]
LIAEVSMKAELAIGQDDMAWAQRRGGGSARDTLSYLDQVAALGGIPSEELDDVLDLAIAVLGGDAGTVVACVERMTAEGNDPQQIASDMLSHVRDAFVHVVSSHGNPVMPPLLRRLSDNGVEVGVAQLSRVMEVVGRSSLELRDGIDPVVVLEAILVGVSGDIGSSRSSRQEGQGAHVAVFEDRIRLLEEELKAVRHDLSELMRGRVPAGGGPSPAPATREAGRLAEMRRGMMRSQTERSPSEATIDTPAPLIQQASTPLPSPDNEPKFEDSSPTPGEEAGGASGPRPTQSDSPSLPSSTEGSGGIPSRERLVADWANVIRDKVKPMARSLFQSARFLEVDGDRVVVAFDSSFYIERATPLTPEIEDAIARHFGVPKVRLQLVVGANDSQKPVPTEKASGEDASAEELIEDFMQSEETVDASPIAAAVTRVFPGAKPIE